MSCSDGGVPEPVALVGRQPWLLNFFGSGRGTDVRGLLVVRLRGRRSGGIFCALYLVPVDFAMQCVRAGCGSARVGLWIAIVQLVCGEG